MNTEQLPVSPDTVVSLSIELHDAQGELIHAPEEPYTYLHGGHGGLLEALEEALDGYVPGETLRIQLEPDQAYGDYDAELLRIVPRERYGDGLEMGMEVEDAFEGEAARTYIVTDMAGDQVVLDGNHPLAGMALRFACTVLSVRPAEADELEAGAPRPAAANDADAEADGDEDDDLDYDAVERLDPPGGPRRH